MACEEQKSTTREDETKSNVDFLFFTRNDVFCNLLRYRSTKNEIYLFYTTKNLNKLGKNREESLLKCITPCDDVICVCTVITHSALIIV